MKEEIAWQDLEDEVESRGIKGLSISNGQHLIDSGSMIVGYVSTPIGGEPSWVFYDQPTLRANESLIRNAIRVSSTSLYEWLFQSYTKTAPPFKTSSELVLLLKKLTILENK